jgi:hypothetical protein
VYSTFVKERGGGEGRRKIRRNNYYSTLLKYVPTSYFLLPLAKLLPLTNEPKKRRRIVRTGGYYEFSSYFLLLLQLTDWAQYPQLFFCSDTFCAALLKITHNWLQNYNTLECVCIVFFLLIPPAYNVADGETVPRHLEALVIVQHPAHKKSTC